jgi:hypothetical protein
MSQPLTIHRYETRGGTIVAVQVSTSNVGAIAEWTGGATHRHTREHDYSVSVGSEVALPGDWVVRYPDGRFVVLSDADFNDRYQRT